jgi:translocation and assembly module TamB
MKPPSKKNLGAAMTIALTVALFSSLAWILATPGGNRWLLESAIPLSGISFTVKKIEGKIFDHLLLTDVRLALAEKKVEIDTIEFRWKPILLLTGTIALQELIANGVKIQDDTKPDNQPPNLVWPKLSANAKLFDGSIGRLRMTNLSYRSLQEQPVRVTHIDGSVTWADGILSIDDLKGESPFCQVIGNISAGFDQPSLAADLAVLLAHPLAEMNRFTLQAIKSEGDEPEPFVGTVAITGYADKRKLLELGGDIGMAQNAINLRRLRLTRPGQKGVITADGSLAFTTLESVLALQINLAGLDLSPELNMPTALSGSLKFAGTLSSYRGDFTLANSAKGWQAATISATYKGTLEGMKLAPFKGSILDGSLEGNLDIDWRNGFAMRGAINGRNLNPARLDPAWKGVANFNATGNMASSETTPLNGSIRGILLESRLHGQALTGALQANFADSNLSLTQLKLQGKGFDLQASGELNQRLVIAAQISNFSLLIPGSEGMLQARGWIRRHDGQVCGAAVGAGKKLAYAGMQISSANLNVRLDEGREYPFHASATLRDVLYDGYTLDTMTVTADGTLQRHTLNASLRSVGSEAQLAITAGYGEGIWKGAVNHLAGSDSIGPWKMSGTTAFSVSADKISLSPMIIAAGGSERLEVAANLALNPLSGRIQAQWDGLNLARADNYLENMQVSGNSHGKVNIGFLPEKRLTITGNASASGTFTGQDSSITIEQSLITFNGNEQGIQSKIKLTTADDGTILGKFSSSAPFRLEIPEKGNLAMEFSGINLTLFKPWLPKEFKVGGRITGRTNGNLIPGQRFELEGKAALSDGSIHQEKSDGGLDLTSISAAVSWGWRGDALSGNLSVATGEYGQAKASFKMPLAASFPLATDPDGPLRSSVIGQSKENGIISSLFPKYVNKSYGEINANIHINGTWKEPLIGGTLRLTDAGAYLPTAGIHLNNMQLAASLENNLIRIDSYRVASGSGYIEGSALVTLAGWQVMNYKGTIKGKDFQTVHLPELRILSTPDLSFEGTTKKITMSGELNLPELRIIGAPSRTAITESSDVILEGRAVPLATNAPLIIDSRIRVLLGEKVFVKVAGIDAQLGGAVNLTSSGLDNISSKGEIKVNKGRYRTYGVNLEIVRGHLFFAGGPIDHPSIDILALRTIGDVRAGVTVTGTLQKPVTKLYSEPAMPDVDVLAYIVLGHPLGSSGEQASIVAQAAGALLTSAQAEVLQDQIKNKLGLSTLEIQGGVGAGSGAMGYKPLQVTAPGEIPASQQPGITQTVLTVGKYVTPKLYISYGRSLFTGSNLFLLRYDIFNQWQIETQTGSESGVDLFYKLVFM